MHAGHALSWERQFCPSSSGTKYVRQARDPPAEQAAVPAALPARAGSDDQLASVFRSINLYLYFAKIKVAQIDY